MKIKKLYKNTPSIGDILYIKAEIPGQPLRGKLIWKLEVTNTNGSIITGIIESRGDTFQIELVEGQDEYFWTKEDAIDSFKDSNKSSEEEDQPINLKDFINKIYGIDEDQDEGFDSSKTAELKNALENITNMFGALEGFLKTTSKK